MGNKNNSKKKPDELNESSEIERVHRKKLQNFCKFIDNRKDKITQEFQAGGQNQSYENTGPQSWWEEAKIILQQLRNVKAFKTSSPLCDLLLDILENEKPTKYIRSFNNKCYMEYIFLLEHQPQEEDIQTQTTVVSQERFFKILKELSEPNRSQSQSNPEILKKNESILNQDQQKTEFNEQVKQTRRELMRKAQSQIFNFVEKEVNQSDHIVAVLIGNFIDYLECTYSFQIKSVEESRNSDEVTKKYLTFKRLEQLKIKSTKNLVSCKFYSDIVKARFYIRDSKKDEIFKELATKCIFRSKVLYKMLTTLIEIEYEKEIFDLQNVLGQRKSISIRECEISEVFLLKQLQYPYEKVIEHFKQIMSLHCPVKQFESIGKLKRLICESVDLYYQQYPSSDNKQRTIESDTFLSVIIYCFTQYGDASLIKIIKLIDQILPSSICNLYHAYFSDTDYGELSWIWISLCGGVQHLQNMAVEKEKRRESFSQQMDVCMTSVIKMKMSGHHD